MFSLYSLEILNEQLKLYLLHSTLLNSPPPLTVNVTINFSFSFLTASLAFMVHGNVKSSCEI